MARSEPTSTGLSPATAPQAESLTDIERKILDFMVQYLRANTYQPSIREIGRRFGIKSTKTVSEHLHVLAEKGYLERDSSRSRGVRILGVDLSTETVSVPCFSEMPDDPATAAEASGLERMSIDRRLGGTEGSFFLRASGADLALLGVEEGDLVLVSPVTATLVEDGAVVLARTGAGTVFHRLRRNGRGVVLESLGSESERVGVDDPEQLELLGRVAGFYRRMDESVLPAPTRH
ncbi:MAG: transcriptional repressor LexA [Gemmatimonadota bacterium]|nr:transcriptional repressor LexA [Gemmatimonadota bacterium]